MTNPLTTVVIPCYNAATTLAETMASVRAQTVGEMEIIAVDDGSCDGTADLLAELAANEPRLRIVTQANKGLAGARNTGILLARGSFIALIDADDLWDNDYLEQHLAHLSDAAIGVSFGRVRYIDVAGRPTGQVTRPKLDMLTAADLLRANPCTSLVVARRDVFDGVGLFDERLRRVEDQEWLFRVAVGGWQIRAIDRVLAGYRIVPGSLSSNVDAMRLSHDAFLATADALAPDLVRLHRRLAQAAMLRYCARRTIEHGGDPAAARRYIRSALAIAPDLLLREPRQTFAALLTAHSAGVRRLVVARQARLLSQEA